MAFILGIETSCDETAAAVFCTTTKKVLSNELFSQIDIHKPYGGVLPELAARTHMEKIGPIVSASLEKAGVKLEEIDSIAVTQYPGLIGALLVGICFAKTLAWTQNKKLIAVDHNHGHIASAWLDNEGKIIKNFPFPHLAISLSGGHSTIYKVENRMQYSKLCDTLDDSAGEAFDKISKLMGLGYPGGPKIEQLARSINFIDEFKYPRAKDSSAMFFSFSGLKTAVLYHLKKLNAINPDLTINQTVMTPDLQAKVASSLLCAVTAIVENKLELSINQSPEIKAISFVGGVSANRFMAQRLKNFCTKQGLEFFGCERQFCTDNAAMIALAGNYLFEAEKFVDLDLDVIR